MAKQKSIYPATWEGYSAEALRGPVDHSIAAMDDLSWPVPQFQRYEEFTPGPYQKGLTPSAYDQLGWHTRQEDEWGDEMWEFWADDVNLVETLQWFDQPPLYRSPALPREWEEGDHYGMEVRPVAFADFQQPRAQQHLHERACAPMMKRRIACMAQAMTNPYKSCIRWLDAEARCFQSIFCKKELVEFEACTEGGNPALGPLCTEYQAALNNCMTKLELFWSMQHNSYFYPDDDLDLEPDNLGLQAGDYDSRTRHPYETRGLGEVDYKEYLAEQENDLLHEDAHMPDYDADEFVDPDAEWYFDPDSNDDEDWDTEDGTSEELEERDSEEIEDSDEDLTDDIILDQDEGMGFSPSTSRGPRRLLPFRDRSRIHEYHGNWPAKRSFEKRIDDAETYDPDAPGVQYFPIPVRPPDGSWEEEQYEIQRARKDMAEATWRNQGQESIGHVYVRREERR